MDEAAISDECKRLKSVVKYQNWGPTMQRQTISCAKCPESHRKQRDDGAGWFTVSIGPAIKTRDQELFHAMLNDITQSRHHYLEVSWDVESWKRLIVDAWSKRMQICLAVALFRPYRRRNRSIGHTDPEPVKRAL